MTSIRPGRIVAHLLTSTVCATLLRGQEVSQTPRETLTDRPLSVADALGQKRLLEYMPVGITPDGEFVAYAVQTPARLQGSVARFTSTGVPSPSQGCEIWVTNVKTSEARLISGGNGSSWAPVWSPDGNQLAFYSDRDGAAHLWVWDRGSLKLRRVSDAIVRPYTTHQVPRWSPDGKRIVTRIVKYGSTLQSALSSANSQALDADTSDRTAGSTAVVFRSNAALKRRGLPEPPLVSSQDFLASYVADLASIELASGRVTTLASGYKPYQHSVSPDGRFVVFNTIGSQVASGRASADLLIVPLVGGQAPRQIARNVVFANYGSRVAWRPDGKAIAFAQTSDAGEEYFLVGVDGSAPHRIGTPKSSARGPRDRVRNTLYWDRDGTTIYAINDETLRAVTVADSTMREYRAPSGKKFGAIVSRPSGNTAWLADGERTLLVTVRDQATKRNGFARVDLETGSVTVVREEEKSYDFYGVSQIDVAEQANRIIFSSEDARHPTDLWESGPDLRDPRRITHSNPVLERYNYGSTRLVAWRTANGDSANGALLLPANYQTGKRYPLILYPYPMDLRSERVFEYGLIGAGVNNMQMLATRGFAVLAPDTKIDTKDQMRDLARVLLPAVDQVVAEGIADSTRVGIIGHSWGGYTVISLLVQSSKFRAAVMRGGFSNIVADYGVMVANGSARSQNLNEYEYGGTLWEQRQRYIDNSPVFLLDRVTTPLLIIHGGAETTVPVHFADEVFVDLRRLGRDVEYARYEGENHGETAWTYPNQRDYVLRIMQWFESLLKDKTL